MGRAEVKTLRVIERVKTPKLKTDVLRCNMVKEPSSGSQVCPRCGKGNGCQSSNQGVFSCWCQEVKLSDLERTKIKVLGFSAECLCQQCIEAIQSS